MEHVDGKYRFTSIALHPHILVNSHEDSEKAREILASAKANCLISNSITSSLTVFPQIGVLAEVPIEPAMVGR